MKHIIITWILGALIFCSSITAYAAENSISEVKPTIAILYADNTKKIKESTRKETELKILGDIIEKFSPKYNIFLDEKRIEGMRSAGMQDITTADRGDIMSFYNSDEIDYIIAIDVFPIILRSYGSDTSSLQLKVIDFKKNKTLYIGKHSYSSDWASRDGHYKELNKQIVAQLVKIFPME